MTDFYKELNGIDPGKSVAEIRNELARQRTTWLNRETVRPEEARKKLSCIDDALKVFATEESKARYDAELEESRRTRPPEDPDLARKQEIQRLKEQANQHYADQNFDLAKIAVDKALSKDIDESDLELRVLATRTCRKLGRFAEAQDHINRAIVADVDNPMFYLEKALVFEDEARFGGGDDPEKPKAHRLSARKLYQQAADIARQKNDTVVQGRALGLLAFSLYFYLPKDPPMAEGFACRAVELKDSWGNAQKVLDDLARVRAKEKARREAEEEAARQAQEQARLDAERKRQQEAARIENTYRQACALSESSNLDDLHQAMSLFNTIIDYKDSRQRRDQVEAKRRKILEERDRALRSAKSRRRRNRIILIVLTLWALNHCFWPVDGGDSRSSMARYYRKGLESVEAGYYYDALSYFGQVNSHSMYHKKAVKQIYATTEKVTAHAIQTMSEVTEPKDFLFASCVFQDVINHIPSDAPEIPTLEEQRLLYEEKFQKECLGRLSSLVAAGDYETAKPELKELVLEMDDSLSGCSGPLVDEIFELYFACGENVFHSFDDRGNYFWAENGSLTYKERITDSHGKVWTDVYLQSPVSSAGFGGDFQRSTYVSPVPLARISGTLFRTDDDVSEDAYIIILADSAEVYSAFISKDSEPVDFGFTLWNHRFQRLDFIFHGLNSSDGATPLAGIANLQFGEFPEE